MTITNFDQAYRTALALAATAPTKELAAECSAIAEEMEFQHHLGKLLLESINHPLSEADTMETMTLNKEQEEAIIQAKVDRLTTQLVSELIEHLEKIGATEETPIKCLGNKPLSELKEWLQEDELVTIYPKTGGYEVFPEDD